jgi:phage terminase Nu1 subunit (DNA packaging protein)
MMTLGEASRQSGVSKGTLSKAIKTGKLSATRREDKTWSIDTAELARYFEANQHRFPAGNAESDPLETIPELRARAELAEQRLADLRTMLEDMKGERDDWKTVATRLSLPAPAPLGNRIENSATKTTVEKSGSWFWTLRWMRAAS